VFLLGSSVLIHCIIGVPSWADSLFQKLSKTFSWISSSPDGVVHINYMSASINYHRHKLQLISTSFAAVTL
jgi:hypothetical protein